eukprot:TRINITY_DN4332_c0_g1_i1.p1 TRINITY_DN4332_c0_g1~~TRINITY_DN4332_c0_g1_i1.p1  ORF type:complete len:772 (-),score=183.95 TRINITY_DN4332_c0_g1_i1:143-2458(-)
MQSTESPETLAKKESRKDRAKKRVSGLFIGKFLQDNCTFNSLISPKRSDSTFFNKNQSPTHSDIESSISPRTTARRPRAGFTNTPASNLNIKVVDPTSKLIDTLPLKPAVDSDCSPMSSPPKSPPLENLSSSSLNKDFGSDRTADGSANPKLKAVLSSDTISASSSPYSSKRSDRSLESSSRAIYSDCSSSEEYSADEIRSSCSIVREDEGDFENESSLISDDLGDASLMSPRDGSGLPISEAEMIPSRMNNSKRLLGSEFRISRTFKDHVQFVKCALSSKTTSVSYSADRFPMHHSNPILSAATAQARQARIDSASKLNSQEAAEFSDDPSARIEMSKSSGSISDSQRIEARPTKAVSPRGRSSSGSAYIQTVLASPTMGGAVPASRIAPYGPLIAKCQDFMLELGDPLVDINVPKRLDFIDIERYTPWYQSCFFKKDHFNYIAFEANGDPIFISIENKAKTDDDEFTSTTKIPAFVRTCKPFSSALDDLWVFLPAKSKSVKKGLREASPMLFKTAMSFTKLSDPAFRTTLLNLEKKLVALRYKFGVMYVKDGQTDENQFFQNSETSAEYEDFLDFLGDRIELKGWKGFRGGLDVVSNSTGTTSVYTKLNDLEIMFHVSTMLPNDLDDPQRLERKRHIGNDVVTLIFKEGDQPFVPTSIRTEFTHIFVVIQVDHIKDGKTYYRVAFASKDGTHSIEPALPHPAVFEKGDRFKDFLLTKAINSERAAMYAPNFVAKMTKTRRILFKEVASDLGFVFDGKKVRRKKPKETKK